MGPRFATRDCRFVIVVHATKKLLDRIGGPCAPPGGTSTTTLGAWYATVLFWKPQVALFVNETTLLPVLVPFAPSASLFDRLPTAIATVLSAHDLDPRFVEQERAEMAVHRLEKTANRSVVGMLNEFAFLGAAYLDAGRDPDLVALALRLAKTPCGPLYRTNGSPDAELAAFMAARLS